MAQNPLPGPSVPITQGLEEALALLTDNGHSMAAAAFAATMTAGAGSTIAYLFSGGVARKVREFITDFGSEIGPHVLQIGHAEQNYDVIVWVLTLSGRQYFARYVRQPFTAIDLGLPSS